MKDILEAIRVLGFWKTLYLRILYRPHMRFIHIFERHWFTKVGPVLPTGETWKWCQWCGKRCNTIGGK